MVSQRYAWQLILTAAQQLAADSAEFTRADLIDAVRQIDPNRRGESLGPVIQGMTRDATGGPPSPCGTPLIRVGHGRYRLAGSAAPGRPTPQTASSSRASIAGPSTTAPVIPTPVRGGGERADIALIGCVKTKVEHAAQARDLYRSPLFARRRQYAEQHADRYYIISAEHGLVRPQELLEPYDTALGEQSDAYRRAWGHWVVAKLLRIEGSLRGRAVEIHAGDAYAQALDAPLAAAGAKVRRPLAGLQLGQQLNWYDQEPANQPEPPAEVSRSAEPAQSASLAVLDGPHACGPFTYRWPDTEEPFDGGWTLTVTLPDGRHDVQVGLGNRFAYGRQRRRLVVWIDRQPIAEAAGTDEHEVDGRLASLLKDSDGHMVRPEGDLPAVYAGFPIVALPEVVSGLYTRDGLAVCLGEDDVLAWTAYAVARRMVRQPTDRVTGANVVQAPPAPSMQPAGSVVAALLRYGREYQDEQAGTPPQFTPNPAANQLILDNPFAFLLAVIFDQGIPAERAWRAPYDLWQRLGHLDPARIGADPERTRAAIAQTPALHRFVNDVAGWVARSSRIVAEQYGGVTARIWAGQPRAADLAQRLRTFPGIGQKKAAMAVEILARDLGVPIRELSGSDIAYDVHVRRVFLRTQLAEYDDLDHIVDVARHAHPERPGELDYPAWLIGRRWCGPGMPDCAGCPLSSVCPQDVARAAAVRPA